jgi:ketol-acid reductoisomerase
MPLNLKDSGLNVIIGLYEGSKSIPVAKEKGFEVVSTAEAVQRGDVIFVALPDTKQKSVYKRDIAPFLAEGQNAPFFPRLFHPLQNDRAANDR